MLTATYSVMPQCRLFNDTERRGSMDNSNKAIVEKMWQALSDMDWEAMKRCMHPEIHYRDVPSDDPGAHGPHNCVKRLQIAFRHLAKQEQVTHHIAADGDVMGRSTSFAASVGLSVK